MNKLVKKMNDIPADEVAREKLAYKATADVLKSIEIYLNPSQSNNITNIYNDNRRAVTLPIINAVLVEALSKKLTDIGDGGLRGERAQPTGNCQHPGKDLEKR